MDAPELAAFDEACSVASELAAARARAAEASALGALERYPFDSGEGLRALSLFSESAACFGAAAEGEQAARVAVRMQAWRARVERDYRDHLLRYRLAVASQRDARALCDVEFLLSLLERGGGRFVSRLRRARDALAARGALRSEAR